MNNNKPGHTGASGAEIRSSSQGQPWVFVLSRSGTPLGLAHPAVVRKWRRGGKARMHRVGPAVARLRCVHARRASFESMRPSVAAGSSCALASTLGRKCPPSRWPSDTAWCTPARLCTAVPTSRAAVRNAVPRGPDAGTDARRLPGVGPSPRGGVTAAARRGGSPRVSTIASNPSGGGPAGSCASLVRWRRP